MQSQSKFPQNFSIEFSELILKFRLKCKGPRLAKTALIKNQVGGPTLHDIKTYYKGTVIKTVILMSR